MSKTTETTLSLLLKLSAGMLDQTRAKKVRQKIDTDPLWKARWLKIRECGFDSEDSIDEPCIEDVDPQIVGQFVEQRLAGNAARQLEEVAWRSQQLLREIVVTFQLCHLSSRVGVPSELNSDGLVDRVLKMVPAPMNGHAREIDSKKQLVVASREEKNPGRRFRSAALIAIAASLFCLAMLGAVGLLDLSPEQKLVEENELKKPETKQHAIVQMPEEEAAKVESLPELVNDGVGDEEMVQIPMNQVVDHDAESVDEVDAPIEPSRNESANVEFNADEAVVESNSPDVPESIYNPIRPHWSKYCGAIGLRQPGNNTVRGYGFVNELTPEMEIHVFPMSWAQADVSGLGLVVVDADSIFKIGSRVENSDGRQWDEQIEISLIRGRLAITSLVADTRILIRTGDVVWPVAVAKNDSSLVVERTDERVSLYTRRGKLWVRGEELARNRQMASAENGFTKPEKTKLATEWVDQPNLEHQLPETISEKLFNSANLTTALGQIHKSFDGESRIAAMQWQWTIQPMAVVDVFRSRDVANWVDAMNWLVEQSPEHPRTRMIWRQLADGPGNTEIAREFMRWVGLRANNRLPTPPHLKKMIEFLGHDRLFVRFVATYLLEKSFGNPPRYRPQAPADVRARSMHVWRQYIAEVYKQKLIGSNQ